MIRIWVDPARIPGGRPILVRAPAGTYQTDLVEIRDERGALVATVRYSTTRAPDARTRVWVEVESQPTANVSISKEGLEVADR